MNGFAADFVKFWGFVGRIVAMATATNIFENKLHLSLQDIPGLPTSSIEAVMGAPNAIWVAVPEEVRDQVLDAYSDSLNNVWWLCLAFCRWNTTPPKANAISHHVPLGSADHAKLES